MQLYKLLTPQAVSDKATSLFQEERSSHKVLNGWFLTREIAARVDAETGETDPELRAAAELAAVIRELPLEISDHALLAGTQRDAFAASYALINPAFQVETFRGYCDPLEVYDYATPTEEIPAQRIAAMRQTAARTPCVKALSQVYGENSEYTDEVAFFFEQVTGHLIPDFRPALKDGVAARIAAIDRRLAEDTALLPRQRNNLAAMRQTLECAVTLAHRYADLARQQAQTAAPQRRQELELMEANLRRVPEFGAQNLMQAMQSYLILWQVMCLEQAPNPFAFSVGNADRIFEPYRAISGCSRQEAAALFKRQPVPDAAGTRHGRGGSAGLRRGRLSGAANHGQGQRQHHQQLAESGQDSGADPVRRCIRHHRQGHRPPEQAGTAGGTAEHPHSVL